MPMWAKKYISFAFSNNACPRTIRQGRGEEPLTSLIGTTGAAFLQRSRRVNRKRTIPRLEYFDTYHEQTVREPTTRMSGFGSASTADSRSSES